MTGPYIRLHVDPEAKPVAVTKPASVPLHWQKEVKRQLDEDEALGIIEKVPYGVVTPWLHRMVLVEKPSGGLRRTVDLTSLNKHCARETHHVRPPFQ